MVGTYIVNGKCSAGEKMHVFYISCEKHKTLTPVTNVSTVNSTSVSALLQNFSASIQIYLQYTKLSPMEHYPFMVIYV